MHRARATFREFLVATVANISAIAVGVTVGWSSPMIPRLADSTLADNPLEYVTVESEQSWMISMPAIGGVFGPFVAGYVADRRGRKMILFLSSVINISGWIMMLVAETVPVMITARFVLGVADGCILTSLMIYTGEIASNKHRGILGSFIQIGITVGVLYAYCIGPYVRFYIFQWICCAVPILFVVLLFYIPESPYYLVAKGLHQQATETLMYLRDGTSEEVQPDLQAIKNFIHREEEQRSMSSFKNLFTKRVNLKALIISFTLLSLQKWTGIDCILSNSELIFSKARISLAAEISTIIVGAILVVSCCITLLFVDRFGRRPVLMCSALGLTICLVLLGSYFLLEESHAPLTHIRWIPLAGMVGFISIYSFGFGPVPCAVATEIFAHDVKALGNTIIVSASLVVDFLALRSFLLISEAYGFGWAFWIFAIVCAAAFVFTLLVVVETKGLSLEEIQRRLGQKPKEVEDGQ